MDDTPGLDVLIATPEHHTLLMENEQVRVLSTRIPPVERTAVHTHRRPASLYVRSGAPFVRYETAGQVMFDSNKVGITLENGAVLWSGPLPPRSLENVGTDVIHVIAVEIKS